MIDALTQRLLYLYIQVMNSCGMSYCSYLPVRLTSSCYSMKCVLLFQPKI